MHSAHTADPLDERGLTRARRRAPTMTSSERLGLGSPARTEMNQNDLLLRRTYPRLTRARGDGPPRCWRSSQEVRAHPRAGADPDFKHVENDKKWLTRARGDEPWQQCSGAGARRAHPRAGTDPIQSTPHVSTSGITRALGRTRSCRSRSRIAEGSPARAGTNLSGLYAIGDAARLTRARGDEPAARACPAPRPWAHPRARGRTGWSPSPRVSRQGSPARAGTNPRRDAGARPPRGLTRARGDEPSRRFASTLTAWAHPRARGRTLAMCFCRPPSRGSPARAGTNPFLFRGRVFRIRLTRARGDEPPWRRGSRRCRRAHLRARTNRKAAGLRGLSGRLTRARRRTEGEEGEAQVSSPARQSVPVH